MAATRALLTGQGQVGRRGLGAFGQMVDPLQKEGGHALAVHILRLSLVQSLLDGPINGFVGQRHGPLARELSPAPRSENPFPNERGRWRQPSSGLSARPLVFKPLSRL